LNGRGSVAVAIFDFFPLVASKAVCDSHNMFTTGQWGFLSRR